MDKENLGKHIILLIFSTFLYSCSYVYRNDITEILCSSDITIIRSDRYESQSIGEWYILEEYMIPDKQIQKLIKKIDTESAIYNNQHPYFKGQYCMGWHHIKPTSLHNSILIESASFVGDSRVLSEYQKCLSENSGYYTIITKDSSLLNVDYIEKTIIAIDTISNAVFICNYHY